MSMTLTCLRSLARVEDTAEINLESISIIIPTIIWSGKYVLLKTSNQNFDIKVLSLWPSPQGHTIPKTYLCNFDPLKPHFYIVKLGFRGVYIIFFISAQKHRLWYSLEPPQQGSSNKYPQSMFWAEVWKIPEVFIGKFSVFGDEIFNIFE